MILARAIIFNLALCVAVPAGAQGVFDMGALTATLSIDHVSQSEDAKINRESGSDSTRMPANPHGVSTAFTVSQSVRQNNLRRFAENMKKNDPAKSAQIDQVMGTGDVIEKLEVAIRIVGLRTDNVADAYALWWVSAWEAVNGKTAPDSPALYAAVKGQASRALLATSQFASVTDAQKQEMAESMLIQAMMVDAYIQGTAGNPAQQAELAKAVNQGAKAMGLDLTTMNLTEQGFSARNR